MFDAKRLVQNVSFIRRMNIVKTKNFVVAVAVRLYKVVAVKIGVRNVSDKQGLAQYNDMFEMATRLCRVYLQGPWKKITVKDISVERISGGLSNWIYRVTLQNNVEPRDVLMRVYGQTHGENAMENIITQSVIFTLLSERGLGPKLHGIFPGGRLEEYIPARSLKSEELSDPILSLIIAEKMAGLHQLNIPIKKDSSWLWDTMDRWLQQLVKDGKGSLENPEFDQLLSINTLCEERHWLKKYLTKLRSPVVFCHNDIQEGNILMKENETSGCRSLCLIDYEYCAYNYRGFDIANHFVEWTYDYSNPIHPFYTVNRDLFPSIDQQTEFLKRYSKCMGDNESPEVLLNEVKHFVLASHLFWGIWSIVNSQTSKITFGYREYAKERIKSYFKLKDCLINNK